MIDKDKDLYIKELEKTIVELSETKKYRYLENDSDNVCSIIKAQEEFLMQKYYDRDYLLTENKRLNDEISRLCRTIMLDNNYINYLLNSYWWKLSFPFRKISRKLKNKNINKLLPISFVKNINIDCEPAPIKENVSIIIFTYNAGEEFSLQLKNITQQRLIGKKEIIVIDRGSTDNTKKIAEKYNTIWIDLSNVTISDSQAYAKVLPKINGDYIVVIEQNKIINSKYWMYQSILPILTNQATVTAFFKSEYNGLIDELKQTTYYNELKKRIDEIDNNKVIFLPENRDVIQYLSPIINDKTSILVKKKIANFFFM